MSSEKDKTFYSFSSSLPYPFSWEGIYNASVIKSFSRALFWWQKCKLMSVLILLNVLYKWSPYGAVFLLAQIGLFSQSPFCVCLPVWMKSSVTVITKWLLAFNFAHLVNFDSQMFLVCHHVISSFPDSCVYNNKLWMD